MVEHEVLRMFEENVVFGIIMKLAIAGVIALANAAAFYLSYHTDHKERTTAVIVSGALLAMNLVGSYLLIEGADIIWSTVGMLLDIVTIALGNWVVKKSGWISKPVAKPVVPCS